MSHPNDPECEQALGAKTVEELNVLLSCLCDEVMTAEDRRRLNHLLDQSPAARRFYLKLIAIHSALITTAGNYTYVRSGVVKGRREIEPLLVENFVEGPVPAGIASGLSRFYEHYKVRLHTSRWPGSIAVALCFVGFVMLWTHRGNLGEDTTTRTNAGIAPAVVSVAATAQQLVAEVTYVSPTVRWQDPNASYALASRVRPGQSLALADGQVELTYTAGTKLLLTGPSEFVVESAGGKLRRGELVARVPEEGHGFTIETPHGQVVDLGTEFGVVVDDFGASQVSVFEGKVETLPIGLADKGQKIQLTSGRALQWTGKAIIPMDATGRRYHRPGEETLADINTKSIAIAAFDEDFRSDSLPSNVWKTIGTVRQTAEGLQLAVSDTSDQRPYLITRQQFDPSRGAITVVCDVRFLGAPDVRDASFAILTRSAQEQSEPGSFWQEMLARFVRCGFKVDDVSGEGMLEAGTKYEADREVSNVSWSGFSRPQPGTRYRLEMHDDGLNVAFTVSLVENPSVRKTISCRSLFRGNHNFIALEGSNTETIVVERLQIFQDGLSNLEGDQLAERRSQGSLKPSVQGAAVTKRLEKLLPSDASLLLEDDFDGRELNSAVWTILGDIVLQNGQVQLGLPNEDGRIDTWKYRPYLLTKQKFDPSNGALIIVGKATFAENFLHGYGGSFAVMTRADDSHGNGPGWENSVLQRGVRTNFWPAALGFNHSLEIHEKPQPNTISLLTAEGFQINPRSRSYLFRVIDDGKSAMLTFIDAENPRVRKTISHPTTFTTPSTGHIGFESCWGSPVSLDDVRVFRREHEGHDQSAAIE